MVKVLMLSTDRKILDEGSGVRARMQFLGEAFDELHIIILGTKGEKQKFSNLTLYPMSRFNAFFFRLTNIDVVSSQDPFESSLIAKRIARKIGAKLNIQIHTDFLSPYFKKSSVKNFIRFFIAKNVLRGECSIRVVSDRIKNSLISILNIKDDKISVLPVFIDAEKFSKAAVSVDLQAKYPQFEKIVLMASRLTKEKDIPSALLAFKKLLMQFPHTGLVIVGEGPELPRLKLKVENLQIEASVIFEPWSNNLSTYFKTVDAFLNTSLYEGYGMTLVEARLAGIPVVSTDVGIAREIIPKELVSQVGDIDSLVSGLTKVFSKTHAQFVNPTLASRGQYIEQYKTAILL